MPRCGCQDACSCLIVAGDGISVEGIGTLERPYEITSESSDLVDRIEFTDDGNVDFTVTGVGTINDPTTVFADAHLAVKDLTDVSDTDDPVEGDVLVWRIDHWEFEQQSGSGGGSGVPPGGLTGEVLTKLSNADGDADWEPLSGSGGGAVIEPTYAALRRMVAPVSCVNGTQTAVIWDTVESDSGIPFDPGTAKFTIPVAGYYTIACAFNFAANGSGYRQIRLLINGGTQNTVSTPATQAVYGTPTLLTKTYLLAAGDTIQTNLQQTSGQTLATAGAAADNWISITKLPANAPGGGGVIVERPMQAMRRHLAATSILNSTVTAIPFDTEVNADGITWDAANAAFIAPVDGYYDVEYGITYAANATGVRIGYLQVGGASQAAAQGVGSGSAVSGSATVKALAGDQIRVMTQQSSGAALPLAGNVIYTWCSVTKVPQSFSGSAVSTYGEQNYATSRGHAALTSIPNAAATNVPFDTPFFEDGITFNGSGFVVPVAGYYDVEALISYTNSNMTGVRSALLYLNGTQQQSVAGGPIASQPSTTVVAATLKCAAGDIIYVKAYQTSGAALTTSGNQNYTRVTIAKVPAPVINGAAASGVWGVGNLAGLGSDDLIGREVYIDSKGQLRSRPDGDTGLISDATGLFTPNATNFTLVSFGARVKNGVAQILIRGTMKVASTAPSATGDITDIPLGTISGALTSSTGSPVSLTTAHAGRGLFGTINSGTLNITNINGTTALTVGETVTLSGIWLI